MTGSRRVDRFTLAGIAVIVALTYRQVLFLGETFFFRDALGYTLWSRQALSSALASGHLPQWSDTVGFGTPFAANPIHGVFSPLGWTLVFLRTPLGFDLYTICHVLIAAVGTAAFARRLGAGRVGSMVAGGALAASGYVTSVLVNGMAPVLAWTPWVAWAADLVAEASFRGSEERASFGAMLPPVLALSAVLAFQFSLGEPLGILGAIYLAVAVVVARARRRLPALGGVAAGVGLSAVLAAVALLPALDLLRTSARAVAGATPSLHWAMNPWRSLEWIWPGVFGHPFTIDGWLAPALIPDPAAYLYPCWAMSLFIGLPVLLLAASCARDASGRLLAAASVLFVLLAMGGHTPVYGVWRSVIVAEALGRYPEKHLYLVLVLWCAFAGVAFTRIFERGEPTRLTPWALGGGMALLSSTAAVVLWRHDLERLVDGIAKASHVPLLDVSAGIQAAEWGGLLAGGSSLLFAAAIALRPGAQRLATTLAGLALVAPLVAASTFFGSFASREVVAEVPSVIRRLPHRQEGAGAPPVRLLRGSDTTARRHFANGTEIARYWHENVPDVVPARFGVAAVPGFEPSEVWRAGRFWSAVFPKMTWESVTRLLGIEWVYVQEPMDSATGLRTEAVEQDGWKLQRASGIRPRAFVTTRWVRVATEERALDAMAVPGREKDPAMVVLAGHGPAPAPSEAALPLAECSVNSTRPEDVTLECEAPAAGEAVLLDTMQNGWTAEVDGQPARIELADGLFRAVAVGPGRHRVHFGYRTPWLAAGATISILGWAAWAALLHLARRFSARISGAAPGERGPSSSRREIG